MNLKEINSNRIFILTISEFIFDESYDDLEHLTLINLEDLNAEAKGCTVAYLDSSQSDNPSLTLFNNLAVPSSRNQSFLYFDQKEEARSAKSKLKELTLALRSSKSVNLSEHELILTDLIFTS